MKSVFISHAYSELSKVHLLTEILQNEHISVSRADEMVFGAEWQAEILSMIRKCSLYVAFVDSPSPNVMLELGYALGAAKPVLLIANSETKIPFDVAALPVARFNTYEMGGIYEVAEKLLKRLSVENREPAQLISGRHGIRYLIDNPDYLEEVSPREFEMIVLDYFKELGFQAEQTTPHSDGGYDIRLLDSATSVVTSVEVKKYARNSKLGVASVHQLLGSMMVSDASMAILVTTGGFSSSALNMARKAPRAIKLLTLEELANTTKNDIVTHYQSAMAKTILIVDESASIRQMAASILKRDGYAVIEAADGVEGLAMANTHDIDLVLTDVIMPNMDGYTLVKTLRDLPKFVDIPILMLTTEYTDAKNTQGKVAGATGWLVKPFDQHKLLDVAKKFVV